MFFADKYISNKNKVRENEKAIKLDSNSFQ